MITMYSRPSNTFTYKVMGNVVCGLAFQTFWNITNYTRRKIEASVRNRTAINVPHGNTFVHRASFKSDIVAAWFEDFVKVCEQQPDSNDVHTFERLRKIDLYEECIDSLSQLYAASDLPSMTTFLRVWRKDFPFLKIPRVTRLGKCDTCVTLKEKILSSTGKARDKLIDEKVWHKRKCHLERSRMAVLHGRSISHPDEWTCICTDWSNPHYMPHVGEQPKGWMTKQRLKYHLFGIANYGAKSVLLYPHFEHWPHDANLHISFLFCYLRDLKEKGKLGRNLMMQMDNCWRDNKNQWFLGFMAHLIELKWFRSVEIYYLLPGHSHDMVDRACFSPLGWKFRVISTYWTPDQFWNDFVRKGFKHQPRKPVLLEDMVVFGWKEWLDTQLRKIPFHSFQRAFLLELEDDIPVLRYKQHLRRHDWRGPKRSPESGFRILIDSLVDCPAVVPPTPLPDELFVDVPYLSAMPPHIKRFWLDFIDNQFPANFGALTDSLENDFWLSELESLHTSSSSVSSELSESVEREIQVTHHPRTIPIHELGRGVIIAVRPGEDYYDENPDEPVSTFWVAKVKRVVMRQRRQMVKVHWYLDVNIDDPNATAVYALSDPPLINEISYGSILIHNIDFTNRQRVRASDLRKIALLIANDD